MAMPTMQQPVDSRSLSTGLLGFAALACLALIAFGAIASYRLFILAPRTANWPTATATINEPSTANVAPRYSYTYTVDGITYTSSTVSILGNSSIEDVVEGDPEGQEVTVHYSPGNPAQAVLLPGRDDASPAMLGGPIIAVVGAAGLVWLARHAGRTPFDTASTA